MRTAFPAGANASPAKAPIYAPETVETAWHILRDFIWPLLKGREFAAAADVWELLAPIRGHNMAKGGLEVGHLGRRGQAEGIPLWKLLGGARNEIPCGVSIGIKETRR